MNPVGCEEQDETRLAAVSPDGEAEMLVRDVMTRPVVACAPGVRVEEALALLRRGRFRHLPVVEAGALVGIVSDRDLQPAAPETTLGELMHPPITVDSRTPIEQAAWLMEQNKIGSLPVVDDGELVGLVTSSDLFHVLVRLLGVLEPSSRLEARLERPTEQLAELTQVVAEHGAPLVSLITEPPDASGQRRVVVRLATIDPRPVVAELARRGIVVAELEGASS